MLPPSGECPLIQTARAPRGCLSDVKKREMGAFATGQLNDARISKAGEQAHMFANRRNDLRQLWFRHARPCAGHPRLVSFPRPRKTWIAGPSPAMTSL